VALSLVGAATIYVVFTWIADNAYSGAAALAADPAPFVHLASADVGSAMGKAVNVAGVVSAFGAQLACINAANRLVFALGRDLVAQRGRVGRLLTRTSRRSGSPVGALVVTGSASVAALLAFSTESTAIRALVLVVEFGAYLIIVAYLLTVVAAAVFVWRHARRAFPLGVLCAGVVVLGYVLYDTFVPFPVAPFDWVVSAAAASVVLGLAVALAPGVRARLARSPLLRATRRGAPVAAEA